MADYKTYSVIGPFILSFLEKNDQVNIFFDKNSEGYVETDGKTVWFVDKNRKRHESITTANVIDVGLKNKALQKCYVLDLEMSEKQIESAVVRIKNYIMINPDGTKTYKNDLDDEQI